MMNREEMLKKVQELSQDETFEAQVKAAETHEDVIRVFEENGVDAPREELEGMLYAMAEAGANGQLSESDLEGVSGGWSLAGVITGAWKVGTWLAGKLVYGDTKTAEKEVISYWARKFGF